MLIPLKALDEAVGKSTPQKNLDRVVRAIFAFHQRVGPMLCALFADPVLLAAYRDNLLSRSKGPHGAVSRLRRYIRDEQNLGRLDKKIDAEFAAETLIANSFFHTFLDHFLGREESFSNSSKALVDCVLNNRTG